MIFDPDDFDFKLGEKIYTSSQNYEVISDL
mgnify:CR=1 FL=1